MLSVTSAPTRPGQKKARPTYEDLEEEVAYLRSILEPKYFAWSIPMRITPTGARILWLLIHRTIATHEAVVRVLAHDRPSHDVAISLVRAQVTYLRIGLRRHFKFSGPIIKAIPGVGYEMDADCRAVARKEILG